MQPIYIPVQESLNYVFKPITELNGNIMSGTVGTRKVAAYLGVKSGDPLSAFTLPDFVLQNRPTTSAIDAGTVTPFGNPSASKQTWSLNQKLLFTRTHSEVLTTDIGLPNYTTNPLPPTANTIFNNIVNRYGAVLMKDITGTAFWMHTTFAPASDYTATHDFPALTIASYQADNGFMKQLTTALAASDFSNYKTSNATGGIDVDGATLSSANANSLMQQMLLNAPRKLRNLQSNMPIEYKPFFMLSHDFFNSLKAYMASTYNGTGYGYLIFATGKDGRPDMRTVIGLEYDGYQVFNEGAIFDEYWEHTNPATKYNHMGIFTARENFGVGFNFRSPATVNNGGTGIVIKQNDDIDKLGAMDMGMYLEFDTLINDTSLFSTVGLELAP